MEHTKQEFHKQPNNYTRPATINTQAMDQINQLAIFYMSFGATYHSSDTKQLQMACHQHSSNGPNQPASTQFTTSPNSVQLQMACHQHLSDGPNEPASNSLLHQSAFDATCNSSNRTTTQGVPPSTLEQPTKPTSKQFITS